MSAVRQHGLPWLVGPWLVGLAVLLAWLPALRLGFVNYDDGTYVLDNAAVHSLDWGTVRWAFLSQHESNWNPLSWLSHAVDWALWGREPAGHHLTSVLLHALNAGLLAALARRLAAAAGIEGGVALAAGAAAGLLFGLHPVQVEAVAWVAQRKTVLFATFALLAALAWVGWGRTGRRRWYAAALAAVAGALLSKGVAVTLPAMLLVLDWYPLARHRTAGWRRLLREQAPLLLLAAGAALVVLAGNAVGGGLAAQAIVPPSDSVAAVPPALLRYARVLLWPNDLSPLHPLPERADLAGAIAVAVALAAAAGGLAVLARRRPAPLAAAMWLTLGLLPTLGLVRVGVPVLAAERYLYLAAAGPFLLAAAGLALAARRLSPPLMLPVAVAVPLALLPVLWAELPVWTDSGRFWNRVLARYPEVPLALVGRGFADLDAQDWGAALRHCGRAAALAPADLTALNCRGEAHAGLGRHAEAVRDFTEVLRRGGANPVVLSSRGLSLLRLGDMARAESDLRAALRADGTHVPALYNLALVRAGRGDAEEACGLLRQARRHGFTDRGLVETDAGFDPVRGAPCVRRVLDAWNP